ncbi:DUF1036 domain-containing protein [Acuticoccus sp. MNP-M23]|uniref:DUF1036 domain-containing protein n=1 Tax=Acuticoccus sp. MNP-M23 TaxID=3072793 RepID=UPI0028153EA6|nr:DUF1036 domain-containing protein [Acuticoccus sp. MNP-M23]WMS44240.1 DUF1036 domain-containing protein [Acuticoccus sp. MNP-M23]
MRRIILLAPCLVLASPSAHAALEICNAAPVVASVAIGYKGAAGWMSEGWWNVPAGACENVISESLTLTHYYWRANNNASGDHWPAGRYMFCITDEAFTIVGDTACADRGYSQVGFNEIVTNGAGHHTITLTEEARRQAAYDAALGNDAGKTAADAGDGPDPKPEAEAAAAPPATARTDEVPEAMGVAHEANTMRITPAPGPGVYGEPYTMTGTFKGCIWGDTVIECRLGAEDGVELLVSTGTGVPHVAGEMLAIYADGQPMTWVGDMISDVDDLAEVTVREVIFIDEPSIANLKRNLYGAWTNEATGQMHVFDEGFFGVFSPDVEDSGYITGGTLTVSEDCGRGYDGGPYLGFTADGGDPETEDCRPLVARAPDRIGIARSGDPSTVDYFARTRP